MPRANDPLCRCDPSADPSYPLVGFETGLASATYRFWIFVLSQHSPSTRHVRRFAVRARAQFSCEHLGVFVEDLAVRFPGWIDRDDRQSESLAASLTLGDGEAVPVQITNRSAVGCCIECDHLLPIGRTVQLNIGGNMTTAEVRWALPGVAGLRLTDVSTLR